MRSFGTVKSTKWHDFCHSCHTKKKKNIDSHTQSTHDIIVQLHGKLLRSNFYNAEKWWWKYVDWSDNYSHTHICRGRIIRTVYWKRCLGDKIEIKAITFQLSHSHTQLTFLTPSDFLASLECDALISTHFPSTSQPFTMPTYLCYHY